MVHKIVVGRFDDNKLVEVADGTSINSALRTNKYDIEETETIRDIDGNTYDGEEEVLSGNGYYLVQSVKSGQDTTDDTEEDTDTKKEEEEGE